MTPTKKTINLYGLGPTLPIKTAEEGLRTLTLSDGDGHYAIAWNGHEFEANRVTGSQDGQFFYLRYDYDADDVAVETAGVYHYPIDPRTKLSDWRRATFA